MKSIMTALLLLVLPGCAGSWIQDFKTSPVTQTDSLLSYVDGLTQVAKVGFEQFKTMLSEDQQREYQAKFNDALIVLVRAQQAVRSAVKAAASAGEEKPDLATVLGNVTAAILNVQKLVAEVSRLSPKPRDLAASFDPVYELNDMIETYKKDVAAF